MEILTDRDIGTIPAKVFVEPLTNFLVADFAGGATAPPRHAVAFPAGKMVFTTGGLAHLAGFRAYETFASEERRTEQQIVAAWDTRTCVLEGLCVGNRLGAIRTGVLGAIAVDALAPPSTSICALIGVGQQAETQLLGMLAVRQLEEIRVYSRHPAHRDAFCSRMAAKTQATFTACGTPEAAVAGADMVVLVTNSKTPVVDAAALVGVAHVTTIGPKFRDAHELPLDAVADRLIVSDSPQQIREQGSRHMLFGHPRAYDIRHLGEVLAKPSTGERRRSLYLSAGLAGTEVVALDAALAYRARHR